MTQTQLIAKAVAQVLASQGFVGGKQPKAAKQTKAQLLSAKDSRIVRGFKRKGITVTLMDRTDPSKDFDVRPYKGWLALGRIVQKGQHGVQGLFHISQTDVIPSVSA